MSSSIICLLLFLSCFLVNSSAQDSLNLAPFQTKVELLPKETFYLLCNVLHGTKPIKFQWFKNDQQISSSRRIVLETEPTMSMLKIYSVQHSDSANYSCQAQNRDDIQKQTTILMIKGIRFFRRFLSCFDCLEFVPKRGASIGIKMF